MTPACDRRSRLQYLFDHEESLWLFAASILENSDAQYVDQDSTNTCGSYTMFGHHCRSCARS